MLPKGYKAELGSTAADPSLLQSKAVLQSSKVFRGWVRVGESISGAVMAEERVAGCVLALATILSMRGL